MYSTHCSFSPNFFIQYCATFLQVVHSSIYNHSKSEYTLEAKQITRVKINSRSLYKLVFDNVKQPS